MVLKHGVFTEPLGTAGILTVVMGLRAFKSGKFKFMPAGLIFILR